MTGVPGCLGNSFNSSHDPTQADAYASAHPCQGVEWPREQPRGDEGTRAHLTSSSLISWRWEPQAAPQWDAGLSLASYLQTLRLDRFGGVRCRGAVHGHGRVHGAGGRAHCSRTLLRQLVKWIVTIASKRTRLARRTR